MLYKTTKCLYTVTATKRSIFGIKKKLCAYKNTIRAPGSSIFCLYRMVSYKIWYYFCFMEKAGKHTNKFFQDCHWVLYSINEFISSSCRWKCKVHSKNTDRRTIKDCKSIPSSSRQKKMKAHEENLGDHQLCLLFQCYPPPPIQSTTLHSIFTTQYTLLSCPNCFKRNNLCSKQKRNSNEVY